MKKLTLNHSPPPPALLPLSPLTLTFFPFSSIISTTMLTKTYRLKYLYSYSLLLSLPDHRQVPVGFRGFQNMGIHGSFTTSDVSVQQAVEALPLYVGGGIRLLSAVDDGRPATSSRPRRALPPPVSVSVGGRSSRKGKPSAVRADDPILQDLWNRTAT